MIRQESQTDMKPASFRSFICAIAVTNIADGITLSAIPLLASQLSDSPKLIGLVAAMRMLPWLLFALPVSVLVDRLSKAKLIAFANIIRFFCSSTVIIFSSSGNLNVHGLIIIALALGVAEVICDSSIPVMIPQYIQKEKLQKTNNLLELCESIGNKLIGTMIGSFLMEYSISWTYATSAVGHIFAGVVFLRIFTQYSKISHNAHSSTFISDLYSGLVYVIRHRALVVQATIGIIWNLSFSAIDAILVVFVVKDLKLPSWTFGTVLGIGGLGAIIGALATNSIINRLNPRGAFLSSVALFSVGILITPIGRNITAVSFGIFASSFALSIARVVLITARQHLIPFNMLGRSLGFFRLLTWGVLPMGAFWGGFITEWLGSASAIYLIGLLALSSLPIAVYGLRINDYY